MKKHIKKSSAILLVVAIALIAVGGIRGAQASLSYFSDDYNATFYMSHIKVQLLENGTPVGGEENATGDEAQTSGELVQYLGYSAGMPGEAEPGRTYREELSARNSQDIPVFLRMTVKKYWVDRETGEKVDDMDKMTSVLNPDKIRLTYGADKTGKKAYDLYNTSDWVINPNETTTESATYYYKTTLAKEETAKPLFDRLMIDPSMMTLENITEEKDAETGKTIYTYEYLYDGYVFVIEADVQALQPHNAKDAVRSQWGVDNVKVDFDMKTNTGTLSIGAE